MIKNQIENLLPNISTQTAQKRCLRKNNLKGCNYVYKDSSDLSEDSGTNDETHKKNRQDDDYMPELKKLKKGVLSHCSRKTSPLGVNKN